MINTDSISKLMINYMPAVATCDIIYEGNIYPPRRLRVSPLIFRGFTCPASCGGCCFRVTLDYLPLEDKPINCKTRRINVNGRDFIIFSDMQDDHENKKCRHLRQDDGRCKIHGHHPFLCDFELIKVITFNDHSDLTQKLFGRGWRLDRVDGGKGALCQMTPIDDYTINEVIRKLYRFKQWAEYFELPHRIDLIIAWAEEFKQSYDASALEIDVANNRQQGLIL